MDQQNGVKVASSEKNNNNNDKVSVFLLVTNSILFAC
jgi:hypothetical protein